jgi:hypothetical protein
MINAIDEKLIANIDVDFYRIKILVKDSRDVFVYEDPLGDSDEADPTMAIGGLSIVIHRAP